MSSEGATPPPVLKPKRIPLDTKGCYLGEPSMSFADFLKHPTVQVWVQEGMIQEGKVCTVPCLSDELKAKSIDELVQSPDWKMVLLRSRASPLFYNDKLYDVNTLAYDAAQKLRDATRYINKYTEALEKALEKLDDEQQILVADDKNALWKIQTLNRELYAALSQAPLHLGL